MNNNTISSAQLEKLLGVNAKAVEISTIVSSQFGDINEKLDALSEHSYKSAAKIDELDRKILKLNFMFGSGVVTAISALIALLIKIFVG